MALSAAPSVSVRPMPCHPRGGGGGMVSQAVKGVFFGERSWVQGFHSVDSLRALKTCLSLEPLRLTRTTQSPGSAQRGRFRTRMGGFNQRVPNTWKSCPHAAHGRRNSPLSPRSPSSSWLTHNSACKTLVHLKQGRRAARPRVPTTSSLSSFPDSTATAKP